MTVGVIDELRERGIRPSELWCDTSYGSGRNGWEAELRGAELVSPVGGRTPGEADEGDGTVRLTAADFDIDVMARRAAVCPAGHEAVSECKNEDAPERVEMHFAREDELGVETAPWSWPSSSAWRREGPARCLPQGPGV